MPKIIDLEVLDNFKTRQDEQNDGHFLKRSDVTKDGNDVKVVIDESDSSKDLKVLTPESIYGDVENKIIDISHIPASAREYVIKVANQDARYALTKNEAQKGDVVHEQDTGLMFFVVDDNQLNKAAGYQEFTAGTAAIAASVPWSGVTNPPQTYKPSSHSHVGTEVKLTGYSKASSAAAVAATDTVNTAIGKVEKSLDGKAASSHSHVGTEVKLTGYSKASSAAAVAATDTVNVAIGKVEKSLDGKAASSHSHVGTEVKLTGYSKASSAAAVAATDTVNTAIGKVEKSLDGKAASSHTHGGGDVTSAVANATTASKLSTTIAGKDGTPVYFSGGTPQAVTKIGGGDTDSTYIPIIIPIQQPSPLQAGMIWIETES